MKVAILGAGIMGITVAHRLNKKYQDAKITIYAKDRSPNTTSDISAGYWEPYCLDESSDQKNQIIKWGKETYEIMLQTALSKDAKKCGVQSISAYVFQNIVKTPFWSTIVSQYRELNCREFNSVVSIEGLEPKYAFHFISTTVDVSKYLPVLTKELEEKGINFLDKTLTTLSDFIEETKSENFDYIINCTGLGAGKLCNDSNMHPVRGQVIRVKAPWIKNCLMLETECTYILPLDDLVVLGGSQDFDVYDTVPNEHDCLRILERCSKLMPSLKDAEIVNKSSGLRPFRKNGIRLELEVLVNEDKSNTKVIHNYGHGGSGITLCWGCATNVLELIQNDYNINSSTNQE